MAVVDCHNLSVPEPLFQLHLDVVARGRLLVLHGFCQGAVDRILGGLPGLKPYLLLALNDLVEVIERPGPADESAFLLGQITDVDDVVDLTEEFRWVASTGLAASARECEDRKDQSQERNQKLAHGYSLYMGLRSGSPVTFFNIAQ